MKTKSTFSLLEGIRLAIFVFVVICPFLIGFLLALPEVPLPKAVGILAILCVLIGVVRSASALWTKRIAAKVARSVPQGAALQTDAVVHVDAFRAPGVVQVRDGNLYFFAPGLTDIWLPLSSLTKVSEHTTRLNRANFGESITTFYLRAPDFKRLCFDTATPAPWRRTLYPAVASAGKNPA
ncbi:MAG: hypothetical protein V2A74_02410, partial [bacterium]